MVLANCYFYGLCILIHCGNYCDSFITNRMKKNVYSLFNLVLVLRNSVNQLLLKRGKKFCMKCACIVQWTNLKNKMRSLVIVQVRFSFFMPFSWKLESTDSSQIISFNYNDISSLSSNFQASLLASMHFQEI